MDERVGTPGSSRGRYELTQQQQQQQDQDASGSLAEKELRQVAETLSRTGKVLSAGLSQANEQAQRLRGSIARLERAGDWSTAERKRAEDEISGFFNSMREVLRAKEEELLRDTKGVFEVQDEDNKRRLEELVLQGQKLSKACGQIQSLHEGTSNATIGSLNSPLNALLEALETSGRTLDKEEELIQSEMSRVNKARPGSASIGGNVDGAMANSDDRGVKFYFCNDQSIQRQIESIEMIQYENAVPPVVLVGTPAAVDDESQRRRLTRGDGARPDLHKKKITSDFSNSNSFSGSNSPRHQKKSVLPSPPPPPPSSSLAGTPKGNAANHLYPSNHSFSASGSSSRNNNNNFHQNNIDNSEKKQFKIKAVIPYEEDSENRGVVHYLGSKGNTSPFSNPAMFPPDDPFLVVLRASSRIEGDLASLAGFKHQDGAFFETDSALSSWVSVELPSPLAPSHYTLGYYINGQDHIPRNWVLQGSQDNLTWATLKVHENDTALDGDMHIATWRIPEQANNKGPFRFFRIMQTGPTSTGTMFLVLSFLELFGTLFQHQE